MANEEIELYGIFYCVPQDDEGGHGGTNGIYECKESLFQAWKEILFENQYEYYWNLGDLEEFSIEEFEAELITLPLLSNITQPTGISFLFADSFAFFNAKFI